MFGMLCVAQFTDLSRSCMNFWEDPVVHYETLEQCLESARNKANEIKSDFAKKEIPIAAFEIWCIETSKSSPAKY